MSADKLTFEEGLTASGLRLAVIVSRFNSFVTEPLLEGALEAIRRSGGDEGATEVIRVPGAWELPITVQTVAELKKHDAIICLGAVIRGGTPHFDYVAGEAARGIASASLAAGIPVVFGVLTTNTEEEATDRAGGKFGNKGIDAAMTAIEMATLLKKLRAGA